MRQREGHIMHLAEETAVLKDQVDALRELSVMVLKDDSGTSSYRSSFPPSAVVLDSPVSLYTATILTVFCTVFGTVTCATVIWLYILQPKIAIDLIHYEQRFTKKFRVGTNW